MARSIRESSRVQNEFVFFNQLKYYESTWTIKNNRYKSIVFYHYQTWEKSNFKKQSCKKIAVILIEKIIITSAQSKKFNIMLVSPTSNRLFVAFLLNIYLIIRQVFFSISMFIYHKLLLVDINIFAWTWPISSSPSLKITILVHYIF